jgi:uncharacterized protein (AIM24 family)
MATHILVTSKPTEERAKKVKNNLEGHGMVIAKIVPNGKVFEVWAKPSVGGKIYVGELKSKGFALYVKMEQYGKDGEVF